MSHRKLSYKSATAICCLVLAQPALAQAVELESIDGLISVRGNIVDYDGVKIKLESSLGVVEVPSRQMRCLSDDCPQNIAWAVTEQNVTIAVENSDYQALLTQLSDAYAQDLGGAVSAGEGGAFTVAGADGVMTLNIDLLGADALADADVAIKPFSADSEVLPEFDNAVAWATDIQPAHQILATDAMAVIVAPDVEIDAISLEDLARIFAGEVTNWSQLGGGDAAILPLKREPGSAAIRDFSEIVMKPAAKEVAASILTVGSDERIVETVEQFPGSIAVVDIARAGLSSKLPLRGQCGAAVAPTDFAIKSGDYPLLRPVLVERQTDVNSSMMSSLIDLAATKSWQANLAAADYLDQSAILETADDKSGRVSGIMASDIAQEQQDSARAMVETLFSSSRLSVTFQDDAVTAPIAAWNRAGLVRLQEALRSGAYDNSEILFVGHSTAQDDALSASQASAQDVMEAFKAFAPEYNVTNSQNLLLSSVGFGSVSPVSCHNGPLSSAAGNRVEIWIRALPE